MRLAFNFLRSYWEVVKDLENPQDRLAYLEALIERQFTGKEPTLEGLSKIVYNGQKYHIDKSVEGYETKTKTKLTQSSEGPNQGSSEGPSQGSSEGPSQGSSEGPNQGSSEGPTEGIAGGVIMTTEGPTEGSSEGPSLQEQEQEQEQVKEEKKSKLVSNINTSTINTGQKFDSEFYRKYRNEIELLIDNSDMTLQEAIQTHKECLTLDVFQNI